MLDNIDKENMAYLKKLNCEMERGPYVCPDAITKVLDFLYLGDQDGAQNVKQLVTFGITHVINCAAHYCRTGPQFYGNVMHKYVEFKAEDDEEYDMMQHFDEAFKVIEDARLSGGKALIHCGMGVNRSGVLTVAYVMLYHQWGPITAAIYVKKLRKMLLSNSEFQSQLIDFARNKNLLHLDEADNV